MADKAISIDSKVLNHLEIQTGISKKQLKEMYHGFKKEFPSKFLDLDGFKQLYREYFPDGSPAEFAEHVYRQFDANCDGVVDFKELIIGIIVSHCGTTKSKKKQIFEIYDIDGNGVIAREEMLQIITSLYKIKINKTTHLPQDWSTPQKSVDKIYSLLDKDMNGELTFDEFVGDSIDTTLSNILFGGEECLPL